jgi:hypothetical protein
MNKEQLLHLTKSELADLILKIYQECEGEIWKYHEMGDDKYGMTPEQEEKVNKLVERVHNTAYSEIIKTINNFYEKQTCSAR